MIRRRYTVTAVSTADAFMSTRAYSTRREAELEVGFLKSMPMVKTIVVKSMVTRIKKVKTWRRPKSRSCRVVSRCSLK